jgi:hypothetical protein
MLGATGEEDDEHGAEERERALSERDLRQRMGTVRDRGEQSDPSGEESGHADALRRWWRETSAAGSAQSSAPETMAPTARPNMTVGLTRRQPAGDQDADVMHLQER